MDDYDDNLWDTDFDSDGDIDADDDIIGDLLYVEYMREFGENTPARLSQLLPSGEVSPWVIVLSALIFLIFMMIICSSSA